MSIAKLPSVGIWHVARRERGADIAKLRGRVITGMLTCGDAVPDTVPMARIRARDDPDYQEGRSKAGIRTGSDRVGATDRVTPDRFLTDQARRRQTSAGAGRGPGPPHPAVLPEILYNGLPPLGGPGYNLRLPCAEEITETHEHE